MDKCCKIISTYFGPRHVRDQDKFQRIEWPLHGQYCEGPDMALDNLKFIVDIERELDAGLDFDTIIVNNGTGFQKGNDWLDSINGSETKNGKIHVIHRENKGRNFAAYRVGYEKFSDKYDYFMFIPDDHVMLATGYYMSTMLQYQYDNEHNNVAVVGTAGTGEGRRGMGSAENQELLHVHDGMCLIHKQYIEQGIERFGPVPSADNAENYISRNANVIPDHVYKGEIPFSNRYVELGYNISGFRYTHFSGQKEFRGAWPVTDTDNQIYMTPTYNVLYNDGDVDINKFIVDESILPTIKAQIEKVNNHIKVDWK